MDFANCTVVDHPLVKHKLTLMRRKDTSTASFRALLQEISLLLAYEAMRDLKLRDEEIQTPMTSMTAPVLDGKKLVLVAILRAGQGILDGMLQLVPSARVGHIGIYRDPETLMAALRLPARVPRGPDHPARAPPGRARLHGGRRRQARRARLHRPGPRRRRRPPLRHEVGGHPHCASG
jgi:hypothetical protein